MKLTAANVMQVASHCLAGEDGPDRIVLAGVVRAFAFDRSRLEERRADIEAMLAELPMQFHAAGGGGWSFLNACETAAGEHWGEHTDMEGLFALGMAIGRVKTLMPRELWSSLPGGVPYYVIDLDGDPPYEPEPYDAGEPGTEATAPQAG